MSKFKTLPIDQVIPYWRNPRKNEKAIKEVEFSIKKFGYINKIIVDKNNVIIAGHTRYKALQNLGYKEIEVQVEDMTERKAKHYRVVDNRTNEYAEWNPEELVLELKEFDEDVVDQYFPDIDLDAEVEDIDLSIDDNEISEKEAELDNQYTEAYERSMNTLIDLICPHCSEKFSVSRKAILEDVRIISENQNEEKDENQVS